MVVGFSGVQEGMVDQFGFSSVQEGMVDQFGFSDVQEGMTVQILNGREISIFPISLCPSIIFLCLEVKVVPTGTFNLIVSVCNF